MNRIGRLASGGALVLVAVTAGGCSSGVSEAEVAQRSDRAYARTQRLAQDAVAQVENAYGDQGVSVVHFPEAEDRWVECSDILADGDEVPESISWSSNWTVVFDPKRETASLLDELAAPYLADGWVVGTELNTDGGRSVPLRKDGYVVRLGGVTEVDERYMASVLVHVTSPCIPAPQDIRDWRPEPAPSPTATR